ncbi:MAG: hypothetical protein KDJ29_16020 [Hyphomicrobiales bacterium]|nr:hypothetical protein [Hyphomicrobiales bacterium]
MKRELRFLFWNCFVFTCVANFLLFSGVSSARADVRAERVTIEYEKTKVKDYAAVRDIVVKARVLERVQTLLSPLRLPKKLHIATGDCDGEVNAWYDEGKIRICYEIIGELFAAASVKRVPQWTDRTNIVAGTLSTIILHEAAHALFDLLDIPVLGREEDAADQVATYLILSLGGDKAIGLISGSVFVLLKAAGGQSFKFLKRRRLKLIDGKEMADEHSTPLQRMYNTLCLALGSNPKLFGSIVKTGALPEKRAEICYWEIAQVDKAFKRLMLPHVDKAVLQRRRASYSVLFERKSK